MAQFRHVESPDGPLIFMRRNVEDQAKEVWNRDRGACQAVGRVLRDGAAASEKRALWERFEEDQWKNNRIRISEDTDRMRPRQNDAHAAPWWPTVRGKEVDGNR